MFIIVYYTKLKKLWDKSACLRPVSTCNCGASKQLVEIKSDDRLMQFLMGINGAYDHVKNQLLLMDPLPNIDKAYSMMLRVEKQREVNSIVIDCIESSIAMQVQGPNYKKEGERNQYRKKDPNKKDDRYCGHCKNIGHTKETCFKLHAILNGTNRRRIGIQATWKMQMQKIVMKRKVQMLLRTMKAETRILPTWCIKK